MIPRRVLAAGFAALCVLAVLAAVPVGAVGDAAPPGVSSSIPGPLDDGSASSVTQFAQQRSDADGPAGNATRTGGTLVVSVPVNRTGDAGNATRLAVAVPAANGSVTAEASREGDRYVARIPVTDVVSPNASADLSAAAVVATHGGSVVLEDVADLRYVAQTGPATFRNATLAIPADVRGLGDAAPVIAPGNASNLSTTVEGAGPNATLLIAPGALAGRSIHATVTAPAVVGNATVSPAPIGFAIRDAAARGTAITYRGSDPVVVQPLVHPDIGPERVAVTVSTNGPTGSYTVRAADSVPSVPIPASVVGADSIRVRVAGSNGSALLDVPVSAPGRATVPLRIANGSLSAPDPAAVRGYDGLLLRDGNVSYVPIGPALGNNESQSLPPRVASPSRDATAILVGEGVRPARVDLTVVPLPEDDGPAPEPVDPDQDAFVALWLDVGAIVGLLLVAMVGSVLAVGAAFGVRTLSPARSAAAGPRAIAGHFLFGGIGGVACIAALQSLYWGPVLGTVVLAGTAIGLGALLVGAFHGGLTATGLRLGLGTVGAWPTRRVIDETAVPVRVRFTDDEDGELPGEQTIEVRQTADGTVVETAALAGTTTEVELPPGEYAIRGRTAERETEATGLSVETPTSPTPDPLPVHLTVRRPGLQVEVTDAQTDDPIEEGQVTVTTDREATKAAEVEAGSAATTLPMATGSVTAVVSAPGYDDATVEVPIEEELTTVDVALDPAAGTLVVTALVAGEPIEGATIDVEPAEPVADENVAGGDAAGEDAAGDDSVDHDAGDVAGNAAGAASPDGSPSTVGVRTAEATTDEDGRATVELPAGRYRAHLVLDGPNVDLFAVKDGTGTVEADADSTVTVYARFDWKPSERVQRRASGLRNTIRSVAEEATADPTIPLYFAGATEALLDCVDALPAAGQHFATSTQDPDEVASATVEGAEAALEAVGQAMQAEGVREVIATRSELARVSPTLDATPADLLAYLERDLTIASVESRAHEVEATLDREDDRLRSTAPARAVVQKAVALVPDDDSTTQAAAREFAALLLLDAVEQCFERSAIRSRLDGVA